MDQIPILRTHIMRVVCQTERRITNEILGVKESSKCCKCGEGDGIKPMLSPFAFTCKCEVQGQF